MTKFLKNLWTPIQILLLFILPGALTCIVIISLSLFIALLGYATFQQSINSDGIKLIGGLVYAIFFVSISLLLWED